MSARIGRALLAALAVALIVAVALPLIVAVALPLVVDASARGISRHAVIVAVGALFAGVVAGLAVGLPSYLGTRARIQRLARATRALSQGDFDAPLPAPAEDELGELQRAFKRMRTAMEELTLGLRGEMTRQRSILDGMAEGVALLHDGEIVAANPAFGELVGAHGSLEGKTPLEVARLPELAEVIEESQRLDAEVAREIVAEPRTLKVTARPLGGPQRQIVVVLLDTTEARRLERLRRDFVANASHELRTPVAAIVGAVETLAAGAADDEVARGSFIDILSRHADRLSRLTSDLLDIARMEGGYRPRAERVPTGAVVDAVLQALSTRAQEKHIVLSSTLGPPLVGVELLAERAAVEQVLTNLVDNAIKYTPSGGSVTVSASATDERVELVVADTGPGIAAE
ncbi:MAG: histidine kinase dimerization/phospho-acceptor domain-containing protein, partial [Polyangia bacterium]